jgi:DNA-binding CsgD family transcriptional regulator
MLIMKNKILELRELGFSYNEISEKLNCAKSTISYHCSKLENNDKKIEKNIIIKNKKQTKKEISFLVEGLEKDKIDEVVSLRKEKRTYNEIKEICNLSINIIKKICRDFKLIEHRKNGNNENRKKQVVKNVIKWRRQVKIKLVEYKGGKCEKCGYDKCTDALEFHHLDPNEKDFTISGKSWSFDRLKKEVEKCILVCSNCHKEIHYNLKFAPMA